MNSLSALPKREQFAGKLFWQEAEMNEPTVACPKCGGSLTAGTKEELAKKFMEHANHNHDIGLTEEQALEKVEMLHGDSDHDH